MNTEKFTGDSVVGTSGNPIKVYSITAFATGGGNGQVFLKNGTDAAGDEFHRMDVAQGKPQTDIFPNGRLFPNGLFFDKGYNLNYAVIDFEEVA